MSRKPREAAASSEYGSVLTYVRDLAARGAPLSLTIASEQLGRTPRRVRDLLRELHSAERITLQAVGQGSSSRYRVILPDGMSTPWLVTEQQRPPALKHDEIVQRRRATEDEREAHRRYWLARERPLSDRRLRTEQLFVDKATMRALQGLA